MLRNLKGKRLTEPAESAIVGAKDVGFPWTRCGLSVKEPAVESSQIGSMANITGLRQGQLHAVRQGLAP